MSAIPARGPPRAQTATHNPEYAASTRRSQWISPVPAEANPQLPRRVDSASCGNAQTGQHRRQSALNDELLSYCASGSVRDVQQAILRGANLWDKPIGGKSALCIAIEHKNWGVVDDLVHRGRSYLFEPDDAGNTALMYACWTNDPTTSVKDRLAIFERMLDSEADVDAKNDQGWTALMFACQANNLAFVSRLLEDSADVHQSNAYGQCAIHYAAHFGSHWLCEALIERGADVNRADSTGCTPVMAACAFAEDATADEACLLKTKRLLQAGARVNAVDKNGETALFYACRSGLCRTTRLLINAGATVDMKNRRGSRPFDCLSEARLPTGCCLKSKILEVEAQERTEMSGTLHSADKNRVREHCPVPDAARIPRAPQDTKPDVCAPFAWHGGQNITQPAPSAPAFMTDDGAGDFTTLRCIKAASCDDEDPIALPPTRHASVYVHDDVVDDETPVMSAGTDPADDQDPSQPIPIVSLSACKHDADDDKVSLVVEVARTELDVSVSPTPTAPPLLIRDVDTADDAERHSPTEPAVDEAEIETDVVGDATEALFNLKDDPLIIDERDPSKVAARVQALIRAGANIHAERPGTGTALWQACRRPNASLSLAEALIEAGADANFRGINGRLLLHQFAALGQSEFIPLFVEHCVDINARDGSGNTALDFAVRRNKKKCEAALRKAGALRGAGATE